jgi:hypothetical protein
MLSWASADVNVPSGNNKTSSDMKINFASQ